MAEITTVAELGTAGGTLVAGTELGSIYALDAVTGAVRWSREVCE